MSRFESRSFDDERHPRHYHYNGSNDGRISVDSEPYVSSGQSGWTQYPSPPPHTGNGSYHRHKRQGASSYSGPHHDQHDQHDKYDKLGKVIIVAAILQVVVGGIRYWYERKSARLEESDRHRRRRDFERAKRARRKQEEELERLAEQYEDFDYIVQRDYRQIGYGPTSSRDKPPGMRRLQIDSPSPRDLRGHSRGRSRARSTGAASSEDDFDYE